MRKQTLLLKKGMAVPASGIVCQGPIGEGVREYKWEELELSVSDKKFAVADVDAADLRGELENFPVLV